MFLFQRRFAAFALLAVLCLAAPAQAREVGLQPDPALAELGIQASVASITEGKEGPAEVFVFVTYEKAFSGTLYVNALRKDDSPIARSEPVAVTEEEESGDMLRFTFAPDVSLDEAASFTLLTETLAVSKAQ